MFAPRQAGSNASKKKQITATNTSSRTSTTTTTNNNNNKHRTATKNPSTKPSACACETPAAPPPSLSEALQRRQEEEERGLIEQLLRDRAAIAQLLSSYGHLSEGVPQPGEPSGTHVVGQQQEPQQAQQALLHGSPENFMQRNSQRLGGEGVATLLSGGNGEGGGAVLSCAEGPLHESGTHTRPQIRVPETPLPPGLFARMTGPLPRPPVTIPTPTALPIS
jgi:hypothetical protein